MSSVHGRGSIFAFKIPVDSFRNDLPDLAPDVSGYQVQEDVSEYVPIELLRQQENLLEIPQAIHNLGVSTCSYNATLSDDDDSQSAVDERMLDLQY